MAQFHLRWAHDGKLPRTCAPRKRSTYNVRPVVAGAQPVVLDIDATAFEILATVCGTTLLEPQRDALLPTLSHLVSKPRYGPAGVGQFSQAGELSAILGLAQFALRSPDRWLFVRIPEARTPRPDVFALSPGGQPWRLELKGVVKLSSEVDPNARMETCANVRNQVYKGLKQLNAADPVPISPGAPRAAIEPASGLASFTASAGGLALSVMVLAEAALLNRADILPPNAKGCPANTACAQQCLRAPYGIPETSLVGLLWTEPQPVATAVPAGLSPINATLVALKSLDLAVWAGSVLGATESLDGLSDRLSHGALPVTAADAASILSAALQRTRGMVGRETRSRAVERLMDRVVLPRSEADERLRIDDIARALYDEAEAGQAPAAGEPVPLADAFRRGDGRERPAQVIVDTPVGPEIAMCGQMSGRSLRLAPRLRELERWMDQGRELLDGAAAVVTASVLPNLEDQVFEARVREPRTVGVRLDNGEQWTVGREWWSDASAPTVLERLPRHTQESLAGYWPGHYPWPDGLGMWAYDHADELAEAAGVSRCEVKEMARELMDDRYKGYPSIGRAIARINSLGSGSGPAPRRRLWAALDGTIAADW